MRWILGCLIAFAFVVGLYLHFFEREEIERFRYGLGDMVNYEYELAYTQTLNDLPMERVFTHAKQQLKAETPPAPAFDPRSLHRYDDSNEPWVLREAMASADNALAIEINIKQLREALRGGLLQVELPALGLNQVLIVRRLGRADGVREITLVSQPQQPVEARAELVIRSSATVLAGELHWQQQQWGIQSTPDGSTLTPATAAD